MTKAGQPSTSSEVLEALDYPLCEHLLEYGKATKLQSFVGSLKECDGWIRPSYNQCATRTTRLSSSSPNIQQIPARDKVGKQLRKLFTARPGYTLLVGDQGGFQLRIVAAYMSYYFGDGRLAECFNRGEDVHQFFADIYGIPRKVAKNCLDYTYTKVLTPTGWVWLHEVQKGDTVMGYNATTHRQEWTTVLDTVDGGYQSCYTFGVGSRTVHSTANHDWVVGREVGSGANRPYLAAGKLSQQEIHNSKATHKKVLHTAPYDGGTTTPVPYGKYNVDWVQWVLKASSVQLEAFIQGFFLADGHMNDGTQCLTQNDGTVLDAVQLAWHLLGGQSSVTSHSQPYQGKNSSHQCYNMRMIKRQHTTFTSMQQSNEYLTHVGCLVTESGNFVVRDTQSKFITITGNCTFGWLFGAGVNKMTATANRGNPNPISSDVIKGALKSLEEGMPAMPGVKELFIEHAKENGNMVSDWLGVRYVIPELGDKDRGVRASGERKVCNYVVQGFEASLFRHLQNKAATIVEMYGGRQAFAVHDEVGYEVPVDVADYLIPLLNEVMSPAFSEYAPEPDDIHGLRLECEFNKGDNWLDAKGE